MLMPAIIQKWPPRLHEARRKVPSIIRYPIHGGNPEWGFPVQYVDDKKEWFKRYLDFEILEQLRAVNDTEDLFTADEVQKYYRDFMRCLHAYIVRILQDQISSWHDLHVEFLFSLPATFRAQAIPTRIRQLIEEAGFVQGKHTMDFGLSEPQAAAVDTAKFSSKVFEDHDVILVCDSGGGTTDVALLEQVTREGKSELQELVEARGINVGSTNIDTAFEILVESRLRRLNLAVDENTAWSMMNSPEFQSWKCNFGDERCDTFPQFLVPIPNIDQGLSSLVAGITGGKMSFSQDDFKSIFDPQVRQIVAFVRDRIDSLQRNAPGRMVDYLILSGGLGSSAYLLTKMREEFELHPHPSAPDITILVSDEPQLAVCKGLVIDRMQNITTSRNVLTSRICPASYGIVCDQPYKENNKKHVNQKTYREPVSGRIFVRNQVRWIIRKGQSIDPNDVISHEFARAVCSSKDEDSPYTIWKDDIVISHADVKRLPGNIDHADCLKLCTITSDLSSVPLSSFEQVKEEKSWLKKMSGPKEKYYIAKHEIRFVIGPTDLRFELWYNGRRYTNAQSIRVEWKAGAAVPPPRSSRDIFAEDFLPNIRPRPPVRHTR